MTLTGVGPAALGLALAGSVASAVLAIAGRLRAAGRVFSAAFVALSVALVALAVALATNDGSLVYVADHTSRATSWPYRLAGLWGGMAGSLLLWTWMAAAWAVVAGGAVRRRLPDLAGGVQAALAGEVALFCGLLVVVSRPFARLAVPAIDGGGLNPVLLHPAMLYHPPLLYAGAVGLVVPFALAVAGAGGRPSKHAPGGSPVAGPGGRPSKHAPGGSPVAGRADGRWLPLAMQSAQVSLVLLGAGLLAGAHWAYVELGWGGYWAWDPVENGGLLPWLAAVAFLHAAVVARRRRGPAPAAMALAGLAFALGLLGAFLTRSGATESVHAFAEARAVGWVLGGAVVVAAIATIVLVFRSGRGPARPGAIVANNVVLVGLTVVIGFGTVFPVLARSVTGDRVVVTGRYFAVVATPLALLLLALIGVCSPGRRKVVVPAACGALGAVVAGIWFTDRRPVAVLMVGLAAAAAAFTAAGWRRAARARWSLAHLGVAVLLAGVAGTTTGAHVTASLTPGQAVTVRGWTVRLDEVVAVDAGAVEGGRAAQARLVLSHGSRRMATLRPVAVLSDTGQRVSVAALRSTPLTDVQVALRAVGEGGRVAVVDVNVLPLMQLVWWGGLLVVAGLVQSSRRAGTTVTGNGDDAVYGSSPETAASSTKAVPSRRRNVTLGTSGSTIQ